MAAITMPAGRYYVGDLCYVLDNKWDEVCSLTIAGNQANEGKYTLSDGTDFVMFHTAYGDGAYNGNDGFVYAVDSGTIGMVSVDALGSKADDAKAAKLGNIVEFTGGDFLCENIKGDMYFGHLNIDTDPSYEEDEDQEWEDEEEVD